MDYIKPSTSYTYTQPNKTPTASYRTGTHPSFSLTPKLNLPTQTTKTNALVNSTNPTLAAIGKVFTDPNATVDSLIGFAWSSSNGNIATLGRILSKDPNPDPRDVQSLLTSTDPKMVEIGQRIQSSTGSIAGRLLASSDSEIAELGRLLLGTKDTGQTKTPPASKAPSNAQLMQLLTQLIQQLLAQFKTTK